MSARSVYTCIFVLACGVAAAVLVGRASEESATATPGEARAADDESWVEREDADTADAVIDSVDEADRGSRVVQLSLDEQEAVGNFIARVEGIVRGDQGTPQAGITVRARFANFNAIGTRDPNWRASTVSASDGAFELEHLPRTRIQVWADEPQHASSDAFIDLTHLVETSDKVEITIARTHSIAGVVRRCDGAPIAGMRMSVGYPESAVRIKAGSKLSPPIESDGAFRVDGLPPGPYSVNASFEHPTLNRPSTKAHRCRYTNFSMRIADDVQPDTFDLLLTLDAPTLTRARVRDENGAPVSRFRVAAKSIPGTEDRASRWIQHEFRDTDGYFELEGLDAGLWELSVSNLMYARAKKLWFTVPASDDVLAVTLPHRVSVRGRVMTKDGKPVPFAEVRGMSYEAPGSSIVARDCTTDADRSGSFTLDRLDPDDVSIWARVGWSADGSYSRPRTVRTKSGDVQFSLVQRVQLTPGESRSDVLLIIDPANPPPANAQAPAKGRVRLGGR